MNVITDEGNEVWDKGERLTELFEVVYGVTRDYDAGNYHFATRFPAEHAECKRLASEFKTSKVPEVARVGFRMERMIFEMNDTDKTFQKFNNGSRQTRKQVDLFQHTTEKLIDAIHALPIGGQRYV